jgi:hypothetical protein
MDAEEVDIKERILLTRQAYFVSKEKIEYDKCGTSDNLNLHYSKIIMKAFKIVGGLKYFQHCLSIILISLKNE